MNVKHFSNIILRNLNFFVIALLVAVIGATVINFVSPKIYESTTDIFVSTPAAGLDISTLVAGSTFSQQRVKSYAEIINSPMTLQPVIDKLKLSITPAELSRMVHSSAPIDTVIIKISVQNSDSYLASLLANAIARQFAITATSLEISDGVSGTQVKVSTVRESVPSLYPISPKKKINYLFALIFSFLISTGVGLLREIFDQTVKNESHCTKTLLGVIDFDSEADNKPICNEDVYSSRSESFRHIRINLLDTIANQKIKKIAISSSISGEGKSSFSANFAYSVALTGKKVCILECDMRRPSLSKLLVEFINPSINVTANYGMSKLLAANPTTVTLLSIKRNIIKVVFPGAKFDFIACGVVPEDPAELLTSRNLSKVLDRLKNNYDLIILDSPPTLPVGDALLVGKAADAVVLLAKAGVVRRKQLVNTIGFHENIGNNVIGFCLNMAPIIDRSHEYGYQSSKHDYDSTYSYYYQYKNRQKNPYAPLKSYSGDKKTFLEFLKQFKSN